MPKPLKAVAEVQAVYGAENLRSAIEFFGKRGLSLACVPKKGWRFYCVGRGNGPTYVLCWVGIGSLIDMMDAPTATLKEFYARGGDVKI